MANKLTKKEMFNALLKTLDETNSEFKEIVTRKEENLVIDIDTLKDFIHKEIQALEKKSANRSTKPSAKQTENIHFKELIIEVLTDKGEPTTIPDLMAGNDELSELTNQRVSALLTQLKNDGTIIRTEVKKKAHFSLA